MSGDFDLQAFRMRIQEPALTLLFLLQILTIFVCAPANDTFGGNHRWVTDIGLTLMSVVSFFIVMRPAARHLILTCFGLALTGIIIGPRLHAVVPREAVITASGLLYATTSSLIIAHKVFNEGPVTVHRIRGAITVYLNIAIAFALMDNLLGVIVPDAFSNVGAEGQDRLAAMVYFSLTTLTSAGYGDIVPVAPFARSLGNLESVIGQFYIAILISILVGLHLADRQSRHKSG